ncbi:MAG: replicative DNA helicase [Magnetovibrionaceae bacterium]
MTPPDTPFEAGAEPPLGAPEDEAAGFRKPPHNLEAEKALLGAILLNNKAYERVNDFLRADHFAIQPHRSIFDAIRRLIDRGQIASHVTLRSLFEEDEALADMGRLAYLKELLDSAANIVNAAEYGQLVYDLHLKRELINLGEGMVNRAYAANVDDPANAQIQNAEKGLYDLATAGETEGGFQSFKDSVLQAVHMAEAAHKREGALAGVTSGFADLDKMLGGLHPSDLIILAARPSMGKTALATNLAFNAAYTHHQTKGEEGAVVGFFSLEMSAEQLASRIISEQTEISSDRMRKGELTNDEFARLVPATQMLYEVPVFIDDTPALTVSALRTRARRLKRQFGLGLIIVDYLQLVSGSEGAKSDGRVQEVSEITRGLKTLAKELNVPVIALSQLSRQVEQREDKRPQLSDLRESGSIEQDADVVTFIYREEYYHMRAEPTQRGDESTDKYMERRTRWEERAERVRNIAEVIIAKQRHGPIGKVELYFQGEFTRFSNLDREHGSGYD